jgi:hypothetical protein
MSWLTNLLAAALVEILPLSSARASRQVFLTVFVHLRSELVDILHVHGAQELRALHGVIPPAHLLQADTEARHIRREVMS